MIGLAFAPAINTPHKRDADEFRREAILWTRLCGDHTPLVLIDNTAPRALRRRRLLQRLEQQERLDVLALFCHGSKRGLTSFGIDVTTLGDMAERLAELGVQYVVLYACSAGADADADTDDEREPGPGGDDGFADVLRRELAANGSTARVYAHSVVGHTTRCPYVRLFDAAAPDDDGRWLIEPGGDLWPRWRRALRETDLRFRFWRMSQDEIVAELMRG